MRAGTTIARCAAAMAVLAGCSTDSLDEIGGFCVSGTVVSGEHHYDVDAVVEVRAQLAGCAGGCERIEHSECTVEAVAADRFEITAEATLRRTAGPCDDSCQIVWATCSAPPLVAGSVTFASADDLLEVAVPSTSPEALCVDVGP